LLISAPQLLISAPLNQQQLIAELMAALAALAALAERSRSQKPEARSQKPEARSQKPEARSQKPEAKNKLTMKKGYTYILECSDGSYYTGSTNDLTLRMEQHQNGEGANHTKKRLPVKLVYVEDYDRVDQAFYREKQIQGWSRNKKEALIKKNYKDLHKWAECVNETHYKNKS
jgi:putative endonuclease